MIGKQKILEEWKIPLPHVLGAVTDGASNMRKAVKRMGKKWFYCTPHMLNRAIVTALEKTSLRHDVIKPAKRIARYFRSSNKAALLV